MIFIRTNGDWIVFQSLSTGEYIWMSRKKFTSYGAA